MASKCSLRRNKKNSINLILQRIDSLEKTQQDNEAKIEQLVKDNKDIKKSLSRSQKTMKDLEDEVDVINDDLVEV